MRWRRNEAIIARNVTHNLFARTSAARSSATTLPLHEIPPPRPHRLEVSVLGFGGSSLGNAFREIDDSEGIRTVHVAVDHGINLIDTAPFYGLTKAETVLGKALREIPREKYLLATKVARYGYKEEDFDFSRRARDPQRGRKPRAPGRGSRGFHPGPRHGVRQHRADRHRDDPRAAQGAGARARRASWASPVCR